MAKERGRGYWICFDGARVRLNPKITYDLQPHEGRPKRGEYLHSITERGDGSRYLILGVREVRRRTRKGPLVRFELTCQRLDPEWQMHGKVWPLYWYSRKRKKRAA